MGGEIDVGSQEKLLETILHGSDKKTLKPTMRTFDLMLLGVGSVISLVIYFSYSMKHSLEKQVI